MNHAAEIAKATGVSESEVMRMAEAVASRLTDWYGDAEDAAEDINNGNMEPMKAAVEDHNRELRKFAVACMASKTGAARYVLGILKERTQ